MSNIVTITFAPCIDKSARVPRLLAEKKLRCHSVRTEPGGGGINVGRAIHKLGGHVLTLYPAGGCTGELLQELLKREGMSHSVVPAIAETRENIIIVEESTGSQYRFGMPSQQLSDAECRKLLDQLEAIPQLDYIILSGSIPEGTSPGVFASIANIASRNKARFCLDTSGKFLEMAVSYEPFLIKPNLGELAQLVQREWLEGIEVLKAAQAVIRKYNIAHVIVSMGKEGALLVNEDGHWRFTPPKVQTRSTVGAGDSMMGGIILCLSLGKTVPDAVKYGVACGTAATLNAGTELCKLRDANLIYGQTGIEIQPYDDFLPTGVAGA